MTPEVTIPPAWVPLRDLPSWVEKVFGYRPDARWQIEVFETIRAGQEGGQQIRHRVAPYVLHQSGELILAAKTQLYRGLGPSGVGLSKHSKDDLSVVDWSVVNIRPPEFDIDLGVCPDNHLHPFPIQVFWSDIYLIENSKELKTFQLSPSTQDYYLSGKSGAPGRPSSGSFIKAELQRRIDENIVKNSLVQEATALHEFLKIHYPKSPEMSIKTIENQIRPIYRKWKNADP